MKRFSAFVFGSSYKSLANSKQRSWDTRLVALIHAGTNCHSKVLLTISQLLFVYWRFQFILMKISIVIGYLEPLLMRNLFSHLLQGFDLVRNYVLTCTRYFLWDIVVSIRYFDDFGVGSLVHAVLCFLVFFFAQVCIGNLFGCNFVQRPFSQWYGGLFLFYEISTPFLHVSWFLDKMGMTGTPIQLFNGFVMLSAFFFMRIVIGIYESFHFFRMDCTLIC